MSTREGLYGGPMFRGAAADRSWEEELGWQNSSPLRKDDNESVAEMASRPSPLARQEGGDHYRNMAIQPAEFIHANKLSFLEGNVVKRVCRHRAKNGAEDIRKAIHELELILKLEYGCE